MPSWATVSASRVVPTALPTTELAARLLEDAERVKAVLANTLARNHPDNVGEIELEEYAHARCFLLNFGHIFTVNYDLLLYWALMQEVEPEIKSDDGFRQDHVRRRWAIS